MISDVLFLNHDIKVNEVEAKLEGTTLQLEMSISSDAELIIESPILVEFRYNGISYVHNLEELTLIGEGKVSFSHTVNVLNTEEKPKPKVKASYNSEVFEMGYHI